MEPPHTQFGCRQTFAVGLGACGQVGALSVQPNTTNTVVTTGPPFAQGPTHAPRWGYAVLQHVGLDPIQSQGASNPPKPPRGATRIRPLHTQAEHHRQGKVDFSQLLRLPNCWRETQQKHPPTSFGSSPPSCFPPSSPSSSSSRSSWSSTSPAPHSLASSLLA